MKEIIVILIISTLISISSMQKRYASKKDIPKENAKIEK